MCGWICFFYLQLFASYKIRDVFMKKREAMWQYFKRCTYYHLKVQILPLPQQSRVTLQVHREWLQSLSEECATISPYLQEFKSKIAYFVVKQLVMGLQCRFYCIFPYREHMRLYTVEPTQHYQKKRILVKTEKISASGVRIEQHDLNAICKLI